MATWQVQFHLVPRAALSAPARPHSAEELGAASWWRGAALPPNFRDGLDAMLSRRKSADPTLERWGEENADRIDVWSDGGRPARILVHVDVRRADAKFAAGLLLFVRAIGAVLVRDDGMV